MDIDVPDPDVAAAPDDEQAQAAPVPWWRRKAVLVGTALVAAVALIGSLVLAFSGSSPKQQAAIKPRGTHPTEASTPSTPAPETPVDSGFLSGDLLGGDSAASSYDGADQSPMAGPALGLPGAPAFSLPPAASLPTGSLPPASLPAVPPLNWAALINPYLVAQSNAQAANVASAITGSALGVVNSAAILVGDLILFAAYSNNGLQILSQLQTALPAAPALAAAAQAATANLAQLPPPPDFTGLAAAFAAAANLPPLAVPQMPALPPGLPSLPTPEQLLALGTLPAIGLPALPPPPPIGFPALPPLPTFGPPQLPPPPDLSFLFLLPPFGLPSFGLPSFGLPSITRMLGLPF